MNITREQLIDLLTTAAEVGLGDGSVQRAQTRGDITEIVTRRMRKQIEGLVATAEEVTLRLTAEQAKALLSTFDSAERGREDFNYLAGLNQGDYEEEDVVRVQASQVRQVEVESLLRDQIKNLGDETTSEGGRTLTPDADDQGERFDGIAAQQGWDEKAQLHVVRRFVGKRGEAAALAEWAAVVAAFENTGGESAWGS